MNTFIIHPSPASRQDANALEQRRFKAVKLFKKGVHQAEVARQLKVTRTAVHYWYITWEKDGKEGLTRGRPGPKSLFTPEKLKTVERMLLKGAGNAGYSTELWTLQRVAEVIRKTTRVSFSQTHTWRILRAMGWSSQKPETHSRNRNEAAIQRWQQDRWPVIQKKG